MKCKIVSLALVVATLVQLLSVDGASQAQRNGRIKFLRPLQRNWLHSAGRSAGAGAGASAGTGTGRGLLKKLALFSNLWQQPSSNVIIITRPTTTQNDDTTTTTNAPTGTGTRRALPMQAEKKDKMVDDGIDADAVDVGDDDDDNIEILGTNTKHNLNGVNDKISMESMQGNGASRQRKRNKKRRRNSTNQRAKRRKQVIDIDKIIKRDEDRRNGLEMRRNGNRNPTESPNDGVGGNFMRLMNSFRQQQRSSVVY